MERNQPAAAASLLGESLHLTTAWLQTAAEA